jgi:hypothetical protein
LRLKAGLTHPKSDIEGGNWRDSVRCGVDMSGGVG